MIESDSNLFGASCNFKVHMNHFACLLCYEKTCANLGKIVYVSNLIVRHRRSEVIGVAFSGHKGLLGWYLSECSTCLNIKY